MAFDLAVFDLDFTLWDCGGTWCDCTRPPYRKEKGRVFDSRGAQITLYPHVREILDYCRREGWILALASRTEEPAWARELIGLFGIGDYFSHREIYPGSKVTHLKRIGKESGVPLSRMVFFDDELRNIRDAAALGVTAVHVAGGLDWDVFRSGAGGRGGSTP